MRCGAELLSAGDPMKATILVDDAVLFGSVLSAEHGFSAYLEADGRLGPVSLGKEGQ